MSVSAEVDERTLREIYLPAFEHAVTTAKPWTVMCAYNRINGVYASEHHQLLTDVLRSEWGFDGFVVSDWAAVHDRPSAVAAGTDLEMPGPRPRRVRSVIDAVQAGALDETVVDEAALRVLRVIARASGIAEGRLVRRGGAPRPCEADRRRGHGPAQERRRPPARRRRADRGHRTRGRGAADPGRRQLADHADPGRRPDRRAQATGRRRHDLVLGGVRRRCDGASRSRGRRGCGRRGLGRRHRLRRDAGREGIRRRRPGGPGPRAAARRR